MDTINNQVTILHISDLHRNEDGIIKNQELLSSLELDSDNYSSPLAENVPRPSVIIVSGDIIYGSAHSDAQLALKEVRQQYEEAAGFLNDLVNTFLNGDKSKIVIIPGNHDIQWGISKASMTKVDMGAMNDEARRSRLKDSTDPKKSTRWSWSDYSFYEISDENLYNSRLEAFSEFYEKFYNRPYSLDPEKQYEIFDIPEYNLTITGFNSCFRNDHLNRSGLINTAVLSESYRKLREHQKKGRILVATWHHNVSGIPNDTTYMDPRQLKLLNSYSYAVGLHGHQHHSDLVSNYSEFEGSARLFVVSAGTLCSARSHLPTGFKRQYNLLKFDFLEKSCTLFSRESTGNMDDIPIWAKGRINESLDSNISLQIEFPNLDLAQYVTAEEIDNLHISMSEGRYEDFMQIANSLDRNSHLVRGLILKFNSITSENFLPRICNLLGEPASFEEYILFLDHCLIQADKPQAKVYLQQAMEIFTENDLLEQLNKYNIRINGYGKQ